MKTLISKTAAILSIIFLFYACSILRNNGKPNKSSQEIENNFKKYLIKQNISFQDSDNLFKKHRELYDKYFSDYLDYETKTKLEANPHIKINKVYVYYRTDQSVDFIIYSDNKTFCISGIDLDLDNRILSKPINGVVKVLRPIIVRDFGDFEIKDNIIKTRKHNRSPYKEWYTYLEGFIQNDSIQFTESYTGSAKNYHFKKGFSSKQKKRTHILKQVYQPKLIAIKQKNDNSVLANFTVSGEFDFPEELQEELQKENPFQIPIKNL